MDLTNKTELISYLQSHGLYTKHSLGQNFLVDREVLEQIIDAAGLSSDDLVVEVGPGVGTLTTELVKSAGRVVAVEMDDKLAKLLEGQSGENLSVINSDILKLNLGEAVKEEHYKVVANIPYYITAKILSFFLSQKNKPELIVMLVQKEVAERIVAKPGGLSVLALSVQAYGEPEIIEVVKKESFFPSPAVDSAILKIRIKNKESRIKAEDEKEFFRLVHIGFASKRKTLANNLGAGLRIDKAEAEDIIKKAGFDLRCRAQELSIDNWLRLCEIIYA